MQALIKIIKWPLVILCSLYLLICSALFFFQEKLIFVPKKLPSTFNYSFHQPFEEMNIQLSDGKIMNCLLFKADSSKGLIFYMHGNAGALDTWGDAAKTYLDLNYDFFVLDYRGYGKSEGAIDSEDQLHNDMQTAYDLMLKQYKESDIIITGYSIGTGPATYLASKNNPKCLILQAPYYNLTEIALSQYPFIPAFLLRYKFDTSGLIALVKAPVFIFHGDADNLISIEHSYKLKKLFKSSDKLFVLTGLGHSGMNKDEQYQAALKGVLSQ